MSSATGNEVTQQVMEDDSQEEYFTSYEDVEIHRLMVSDSPRTKAYHDAINSNKHLFEGKITMDVGAGTGILSLFMAAAGAKKVYAVEASGMASVIQKVANDNGFADIIHVYHDKVEDICLPENEKVNIIVSEWMGFYLLHESMLNSVIKARDNFLAEDGTVFPSEARIYACPCSLKDLYQQQIHFWDSVYGFDMSAVKSYALKSKMTKPEVCLIPESDLLAEPTCVKEFNLRWVTEEEVKFFTETTFVAITRSGTYEGLCLWFECDFDGRDFDEEGKEFGSLVKLSTSPYSQSTHWKQTVVVFGYATDQTNQELELTYKEDVNSKDLHTNTGNSGNKFDNENIKTKQSTLPCNQQSNNGIEQHIENRKEVMEQASNEIVIQPTFNNEVEKDEVVGWKLILAQSDNNVRHYTMTVEMLDPYEEEHQVPCYCPMPRCLIIAKMLENEMKENPDLIDCT